MQPDKDAVRSDATAAEQPADSLATSPANPQPMTATADAGAAAPPEAPAVIAPAASASDDSVSQPESAPAEAGSEVEPAKTPDAEPATAAAGSSTANPSWRTWAPKLGATHIDEPAPAPKSAASRFPLLAASIALAACVGAAAGGAGVAGVSHLMASPPAPKQAAAVPLPVPAPRSDAEIKSLRDSVAQLRTQIRSLSESLTGLRSASEGTGKNAQAQLAKLTDTIERLEKAQAEPLARLTKLAATVERLERREAAAPSSEVTGSVRTAAAPTSSQPQPQEQRASRQVVEGWRLHQVQQGVALVEGRIGLAEVMIGDTLRGVGRIQDIRREDGRWVVVTPRGLIVSAR